MKIFFLSFLILLINHIFLFAEQPFTLGDDEVLVKRLELKQKASEQVNSNKQDFDGSKIGKKKSIHKAVAFSALVPGSGQVYAKSYIKSAVFFAIEVGAWTAYFHYNKQGDKKDSEFRTYADEKWSEYRYWSYLNWVALNDPNYDPLDYFEYIEVTAPNGGNWYLIPDNYYRNNQDLILSTLRVVERDKYTHQLPSAHTQQYYEMIGKYPGQFGNAWYDADFDYIYSGPNNITPLNDKYMDMREKSNQLYQSAQYGLMVVLINHVISAIDAGFTTRKYNRKQAALEMSYNNYYYKNEYLNMFGLNIRW
jgi:hypothetical protein